MLGFFHWLDNIMENKNEEYEVSLDQLEMVARRCSERKTLKMRKKWENIEVKLGGKKNVEDQKNGNT